MQEDQRFENWQKKKEIEICLCKTTRALNTLSSLEFQGGHFQVSKHIERVIYIGCPPINSKA